MPHTYGLRPYLLKDIRHTEPVQKRFNKRLVGMADLDYSRRLATLGLESLELRRLHHDLLCTYKILSNRMDINYDTINVHSQLGNKDPESSVEIMPKT